MEEELGWCLDTELEKERRMDKNIQKTNARARRKAIEGDRLSTPPDLAPRASSSSSIPSWDGQTLSPSRGNKTEPHKRSGEEEGKKKQEQHEEEREARTIAEEEDGNATEAAAERRSGSPACIVSVRSLPSTSDSFDTTEKKKDDEEEGKTTTKRRTKGDGRREEEEEHTHTKKKTHPHTVERTTIPSACLGSVAPTSTLPTTTGKVKFHSELPFSSSSVGKIHPTNHTAPGDPLLHPHGALTAMGSTTTLDPVELLRETTSMLSKVSGSIHRATQFTAPWNR